MEVTRRMYQKLSRSTKIAITRSIKESFKSYMDEIEWNPEKYDMNNYASYWQNYLTTKSKWIHEVDDTTRKSPEFHEELAKRVTKKIDELLTEEPTKEQVAQLKKLAPSADYSCKLEVEYLINKYQK